jgi:hypothetical protein
LSKSRASSEINLFPLTMSCSTAAITYKILYNISDLSELSTKSSLSSLPQN